MQLLTKIPMSRRGFATAAALGALCVLSGCGSLKRDEGGTVRWTAEGDDTLELLGDGSGTEGVASRLAESWAVREGFVQLQLLGGSIPGIEVEDVRQEAGRLVVKIADAGGGVASMDIEATEWKISGEDVSEIEEVAVKDARGSRLVEKA